MRFFDLNGTFFICNNSKLYCLYVLIICKIKGIKFLHYYEIKNPSLVRLEAEKMFE